MNIFEKFQNAMGAAAFAEAGEFESARQFLKTSKNANKKVLLVINGEEVNRRTVKHAWDLSRRLGAMLEIFHVRKQGEHKQTPNVSTTVIEDTIGHVKVRSSFMTPQEQIEKKIVEYAANRRDILCIVLGEQGQNIAAKAGEQKFGALEWLMENIHCPIMVHPTPT